MDAANMGMLPDPLDVERTEVHSEGVMEAPGAARRRKGASRSAQRNRERNRQGGFWTSGGWERGDGRGQGALSGAAGS